MKYSKQQVNIRIIDTHCHPQFPQYNDDREAILRRALDAGIGMVCVGTDPKTSQLAIALAEQYEGVWASVGIHPNDVGTFRDVSEIMKLAEHPKVVAIGEVGLDYYRTTDTESQERQRSMLKDFLSGVFDIQKPLIIHCRDGSTSLTTSAHADLRSLLESTNYPSGVIHSFTGTLNDALYYIDAGFSIGLNGIHTFATQYDDVIRSVPLERILLETDAPYLAPEPHRGKRNEPSYVEKVAELLAAKRGIPVGTLIEQTTKNSATLFNMSL